MNYSFAVARVRLTEPSGSGTSSPVKVFFRLFAAETSDTDYQPALTYPSTFSGGFPESPLPGVNNVTLPFFATGNYETAPVNADYSATSINNQPITVSSGTSVWAYYGCYLNLYDTANTIGGKQIQTLLPSTHSCLVAQIAYDKAPIPTAGQVVGPENSDKLAQRNLQITFSDNPGPPEAHRVPQTFDLRRGPEAGADPQARLTQRPDELMIDWGQIPAGAIATIYWPAVDASDVLAAAGELYSTHQLAREDASTIRIAVPHNGITFVPVPAGAGDNVAGLFTVDLPTGVKAGQSFVISVRRITTASAKLPPPPPPPPPPPRIAGEASGSAREEAGIEPGARQGLVNRSWRQVVGSFAVRIPVTTAHVMRPVEENTLAIMKWRLEQMAPGDRWRPVLIRYIGLVEGRVRGTGGDPGQIPPNRWGIWGEPRPTHGGKGHGGHGHGEHGGGDHDHRWRERTGKIEGLVYDRFGDFEGVMLRERDGFERFFASREEEIEDLARIAWTDRIRVTLFTEAPDRDEIARLILRRRAN